MEILEDSGNATDSAGNDSDACYVQSLDRRWYLVAVAGTSLSVISIFTNIVIAKVLFSSKHAHFYFLALLAISDAFLSLNYGPVIAMEIINDRLQLRWLNDLYLVYVGPLLALCQTSMTFSTYLIILATIERFLITQRSKCLGAFRRCRRISAFLVFVLSLLLRGPILFEMVIVQRPECEGRFNEYYPMLDKIVETFWYGTIYRFYIRNIMTVMVPFVSLAILNYKIVKTLRMQQRSAQMFRLLSSDHKSKIRSATLLMVFVVCSYLTANILNVMITLWEYVSFDSTQDTYFDIYETCADVVSVLYIFVCATRLFVYYLCNQEIRDAIKHLVCHSATPPRKQEYVTVTRCFDSSRQIGTEIDAVAIAIARRLMSNDLICSSKPTETLVISNDHAEDPDCEYEDEEEVPHMV
ncbi:unnamed protein product [Caenorhabditis bovis]|uniref:G-protein coupled receptors family 1 profile domain-containing protein n=1 Tax=Caenorhabditis bovis TaxID=2654633 RepID=A0A8S1EXF4_9PELO|nr:unnamed protein product [Caenorhabditis bovis]